jgi:ribose/xylose/arabinose/galactoside ABC-type transport system permease subunit
LWVIVLAGLAAGTLCGFWNGLLVSRGKIQPVVATLILMVAGRGIAESITYGQIMAIYYTPYLYFGNGFILGLPVSIYIVALVLLCAWVLARKTSLGLFIQAVGSNAKATDYSGISVKNIKLFVYTFCGFFAAIAGLILSSYTHVVDANNIGLNYELDAILAIVLGGTLMTGGRFSLIGSVLGALIIWMITFTLYIYNVPANALLVGKAVLVLVIIILASDHARRLLRIERNSKK